jgi:hypothetical protein
MMVEALIMTNSTKQYRIPVNFPENERNILDILCEQDIRPPAEQIRWLVLTEAQRRGLQAATKKHESTGEVLADTGAFVGIAQ